MSEHYYTENPESEVREKHFTYTIKNVSLSFTSVSGVFSHENKVDRASELLIESFRPSGSSILDLGCGYGAIGLYLKALFSSSEVYMSDINSRAIEYASLNGRKNNLEVCVIKSDLFSGLSGIKFDDIATNPPIAAGKKLNTRLINESYTRLNANGALWLVAFHNKGGSTLKGIMEEIFGNVVDVEKSGGIRVYRSIIKP